MPFTAYAKIYYNIKKLSLQHKNAEILQNTGNNAITIKNCNTIRQFSYGGFFKSLKAEELYRNNYRSEREFRERVQKYIDFYNDKRPHQINRYRTPNATEEAYFKRHADDISQTI